MITKAKIVKILDDSGQILIFEYNIDGKTYKGRHQESFDDVDLIVEVGSEYELAYNPDNPKEHFFMYYRPIFPYNQSDTTLAVVKHTYVTRIFYNQTIKALRYEYRIGNRIYQGKCYLEVNNNVINAMKKGDIISIRFLFHNNRITIVHTNFRKEKENTTLVYFDTNKKIEQNLIKAAEKINFNGTIYWLKHPNLPTPDNRKEILNNLLDDEKFKTKFQGIEILIF